jgi:hypothetical protein
MPLMDIESLLKENSELKDESIYLNRKSKLLKEAYDKLAAKLEVLRNLPLTTMKQVNVEFNNITDYRTKDKELNIDVALNNEKYAQLVERNKVLEYVGICLWVRDVVNGFLSKVCQSEGLPECMLMSKNILKGLGKKYQYNKDKLLKMFRYLRGVKEMCNDIAHVGRKYPLELLDGHNTVKDFYEKLRRQFKLSPAVGLYLENLVDKIGFTTEEIRKKK